MDDTSQAGGQALPQKRPGHESCGKEEEYVMQRARARRRWAWQNRRVHDDDVQITPLDDVDREGYDHLTAEEPSQEVLQHQRELSKLQLPKQESQLQSQMHIQQPQPQQLSMGMYVHQILPQVQDRPQGRPADLRQEHRQQRMLTARSASASVGGDDPTKGPLEILGLSDFEVKNPGQGNRRLHWPQNQLQRVIIDRRHRPTSLRVVDRGDNDGSDYDDDDGGDDGVDGIDRNAGNRRWRILTRPLRQQLLGSGPSCRHTAIAPGNGGDGGGGGDEEDNDGNGNGEDGRRPAAPERQPSPDVPNYVDCQMDLALAVPADPISTVLENSDLLKGVMMDLQVADLCRLATVNRMWMRVAHDPSFWRSVNLLEQRISSQQAIRLCNRHRCDIEELHVKGREFAEPDSSTTLRRMTSELSRLSSLGLCTWWLSERAVTWLCRDLPGLRELKLDNVHVATRFLPGSEAKASLSHTGLTSLNLQRVEARRVELNCPRLLHLHAHDCQIHTMTLVGTSLPRLQHLQLSQMQRIPDILSSISTLTSLRHLILKEVMISEGILRSASRSLEHLTQLELEDCIGMNLSPLHSPLVFASLRRLVVRCGDILSPSVKLLLEGCTQLEELVLEDCKGLAILELVLPMLKSVSLKGCRNLNMLDLKCRRLTELTIASMESGHLGGEGGLLKRVTLASDAIRSIAWSHLPHLEEVALDCPALTSLSLTDCDRLSDKIFNALSDVQEVTLASKRVNGFEDEEQEQEIYFDEDVDDDVVEARGPQHGLPDPSEVGAPACSATLLGPRRQPCIARRGVFRPPLPELRNLGGLPSLPVALGNAMEVEMPQQQVGTGQPPAAGAAAEVHGDSAGLPASAVDMSGTGAASGERADGRKGGNKCGGGILLQLTSVDEERLDAEKQGSEQQRGASGASGTRPSDANGLATVTTQQHVSASASISQSKLTSIQNVIDDLANGILQMTNCDTSTTQPTSTLPAATFSVPGPRQTQQQCEAAQSMPGCSSIRVEASMNAKERPGHSSEQVKQLQQQQLVPRQPIQQVPQLRPPQAALPPWMLQGWRHLPALLRERIPACELAQWMELSQAQQRQPRPWLRQVVKYPKVGGCPQLQELRLEGCDGLRRVELRHSHLAVASFRGCRGLRTLRLSCPSLGTLMLDECDELEFLALSPVAMKSLALGACSSLWNVELVCPFLEQLSLKGCGNLRGVGLDCPRLRELDATFCNGLTDHALVRALVKRPPLAALCLSVCRGLGPAMAAHLSALAGLRYLDLSYSSVSHLGPVLSGCSCLTALCVCSCPGLTGGGEELLRLLPEREHALPNLVSLDLSYCPVSRHVLVAMTRGLTQLTYLALNGCLEVDESIWHSTELLREGGCGRRQYVDAAILAEGGFMAGSTALDAMAGSVGQPNGAGAASQLEKLSLVRCISLVSLCLGLVPVKDEGVPGAQRSRTEVIDDGPITGLEGNTSNGAAGPAATASAILTSGSMDWTSSLGRGWRWLNGGPPPRSRLGPPWRPVSCVLSGLCSLRLGLSSVQVVALSLPHLTCLNLNGCSVLRNLELRCPALRELHLQACCALPADLWPQLLEALAGTGAHGPGLRLLDAQHAGLFGEAVAATLAAAAVMAAAARETDYTDPGPGCSSADCDTARGTAGREGSGSGTVEAAASIYCSAAGEQEARDEVGFGDGNCRVASSPANDAVGRVVVSAEALLSAREQPWWLLPKSAKVLACGLGCTTCACRTR
ncbi:hypothetical protein Vretimale_3861 [Volvox reticuliferus]|uniref:F-box domain-containing protein n=1 Tax=Volvox reticuliferus TaxID=1737510 RepID=A0A8J4G0W7_9CHLO|nr:hypothetical protein Vretifemale_1580 [Volvox reticuliferus]GIL98634.1 hypothetical protein Vretimale_3861 [Volvox reticuliferus]